MVKLGTILLVLFSVSSWADGRKPFQPVYESHSSVVAGGKRPAKHTYDADGNLLEITTGPPCVSGEPKGGFLFVNGEPLRYNDSPHGITFGNGTTTCYGPPIPSIPKCICTRAPCP